MQSLDPRFHEDKFIEQIPMKVKGVSIDYYTIMPTGGFISRYGALSLPDLFG